MTASGSPPDDRIDEVLELIETNGESVLAAPLGVELPDADDAMFVEVATAANADCLITGNRKHFPEKRLPDVRVRLPSAFVEEYLRSRRLPDPE